MEKVSYLNTLIDFFASIHLDLESFVVNAPLFHSLNVFSIFLPDRSSMTADLPPSFYLSTSGESVALGNFVCAVPLSPSP